MGAEAEADELELVVDDAVKENQVGFDVAVADAGEFALERVSRRDAGRGPCAQRSRMASLIFAGSFPRRRARL